MSAESQPSIPRWFDVALLVTVAITYAVSLWDAASWAWMPLLVPVAAFVVHFGTHRIPAWLALGVTTVVTVALNIDLNAEGAFFLVCLGAFATASAGDDWVPDRLVLIAAVVSPLIDAAWGAPAVRDWNWPFWSMGVAICWAFGAVLLQQRRLAVSLREAQTRLAQQAAGEQRRRIARDVHDLVGHSLTVVLLHLTGARRVIRTDPDEAERALAEAERAGRESLSEIRRTVALLRDGTDGLAPSPRAEDLDALLATSRSAGMGLDVEVSGELEDVGDATGLALYRIVQESLANVARHARGAPTTVHIEVGSDDVVATVVNEGGGLASGEPGGGTGIIGMQERARALGGRLDAGPSGRGWRVHAVLPRTTRTSEVEA